MLDQLDLKYFVWTKHYTDLKSSNKEMIKIEPNGLYRILVHPDHEPIKIDLAEEPIQQVKKYEKSTQLYFFGLVWLVFADPEKHKSLIDKVILAITSSSKPKLERMHRDMIWDDHALSERVSVYSSILASQLRHKLSVETLKCIQDDIVRCDNILIEFIQSSKWSNNNHRIFHICGHLSFCHFNSYQEQFEVYFGILESTITALFQIETGLSVEQSVSYYSFDLILLNKVSEFLNVVSIYPTWFDYSTLFERNKLAMSFLSFPNGDLPASGDTPLGFQLKKRHILTEEQITFYKEHLSEIGHFKLYEEKTFSAHMISHNAESAHGHNSPLHVDLWSDKVGTFIVDSGGPYLYGDKLRYEWFRHSRAHNCLTVDNADISKTVCNVRYEGNSSILASAINPVYFHDRKVRVKNKLLAINETIESKENWSLNYHFAPGTIHIAESNIFIFTKNNTSIKVHIESDCNFKVVNTLRTFSRGDATEAPTITVEGSKGTHTLSISFHRDL